MNIYKGNIFSCKRTLRRRMFASCITLAFAALLASAQTARAQSTDNGIVVGQAKIYDERSLESMLSSIRSGLAGSNYVNPVAAEQNIGVIQGGQITSSSFGFSAVRQPAEQPAGPTPTGMTTSIATQVAPTGAVTKTTTASTTSSIPPTAPKANAVNFMPEQSATTSNANLLSPLAVSSQDMLQQQVGLAFQATNLQMLLEHSLSDRVIFDKGGAAASRALVVLGFQITIEPRNDNKFEVAEAEITISSPTGVAARPQVVMMLPQDKTYNVASVTNNSRSFNLGAFAQPLGLGLSDSTSHNNAYIVYDVDTVALQRPVQDDSNSISFAWQFRPVLGQQAVTPGTRQVYVLLSLPVAADQAYQPNISVRTYWKKLNTKQHTVGDDEIDGVSPNKSYSLDIQQMTRFDDGLEPVIDDVVTHDAGNGMLYVEAIGSNLTPDTRVIAEGSAYNLEERGGRLLDFTIPALALSYHDPVVIGPYGLPVSLTVRTRTDDSNKVIAPGSPGYGLKITGVTSTPADADTSVIHIALTAGIPLSIGGASAYSPPPGRPKNAQIIVTIGNIAYGLNDNPIGSHIDGNTMTLDIRVSNEVLRRAQQVTVRYAFWGDDYSANYALPAAPFVVDAVSLISHVPIMEHKGGRKQLGKADTKTASAPSDSSSPTDETVVLAIKGNFSKDLHAYVFGTNGETEFAPTTPTTSMFLLLKPIPADGAQSTQPATSPGSTPPAGSKGETLMTEQVSGIPGGESSYAIALLSATKSQLNGSDSVLLYQPGGPAQLVQISDVMKSLTQEEAATKAKAVNDNEMTPTMWEMWGAWKTPPTATIGSGTGVSESAPVAVTPQAPATAVPVPAEPSQMTPQAILQLGTRTTTGTSNGGRNIPKK